MLTVYKASAGSGKTFRLVTDYIRLLLQNEKNYRHILAVTFTNKATAEMKERVVEQLGKLADGSETPYREILIKETGLSEGIIKNKAQVVLRNILFDYNRFAISTIDKFTQKIIRSFNREIGISPDFQLELDNDMLVSEAVDRLISGVDNNPGLLAWLQRFIEEKIRNGKTFAIEQNLKDLGSELFKENVQEKLPELMKFFSDSQVAEKYLDKLDAIQFGFEAQLKNRATQLRTIYNSAGYTIDDFSNKNSGVAGFIEKVAGGEIPKEIGQRTMDAATSAEKWITKDKGKREMLPMIENHLMPRLNQLIDYYRNNIQNYYTAKAIKKEWFSLAVLIDLNAEILKLSREKGILPLASSNMLLRSIIDGNETPFIYEKTGNSYHHFMLDEFQDTSAMQWENFKPLIANALGMGAENLTVGDVKQSIYRWRNSDWSILSHKIYNDFPGFSPETKTLDTNYRSDEEVVSFNNNFFRSFVQQMFNNKHISTVSDLYKPILDAVYADVTQKISGNDHGKGYVRVEVLGDDDDKFKDIALKRLVEQVKELQDCGFRAGDIAILVRKNTQGEEIVSHFLECAKLPENESYNLRVLSSESLFLHSSPAVNLVVSVIRNLINKEERLIKANLLHLYENLFPHKLNFITDNNADNQIFSGRWYESGNIEERFEKLLKPLIERVEQEILTNSMDEILIRIGEIFGLFEIPSAIPFLQALIDKTAEIRKRMTNDLSNFLLWWDEKGQKESVQINEDTDAVRLLTIHKAKGLEFKAVLIPFLNWGIIDYRNYLIWCSPSSNHFSDIPLVPVNMGADLVTSNFANQYFNEFFNVIVDNLNLVYVAFTRAKSVLMVNLPEQSKSGSIAAYVLPALHELAEANILSREEKPEGQFFYKGSMPSSTGQKTEKVQKVCSAWQFRPFDERLRLRTENEDFIDFMEGGKTRKNMGNIIHGILSAINRADDLEKVLNESRSKGLLSPLEFDQVKHHLEEMFKHPLASGWFSGSYRIMNEKTLLTTENIYRPDRIMIGPDEAIVVDFKTGSQKKESHIEQVKNYCQILSDTGYVNVKGYLWYLQSHEAVEVFPFIH